jgi:hypothetical protein
MPKKSIILPSMETNDLKPVSRFLYEWCFECPQCEQGVAYAYENSEQPQHSLLDASPEAKCLGCEWHGRTDDLVLIRKSETQQNDGRWLTLRIQDSQGEWPSPSLP